MDRNDGYQFPLASYPAVRLFLLLAAGIAGEFYIRVEQSTILVVLIAILILYLISKKLSNRAENLFYYRPLLFLYLLSIVIFGAYWQVTHHPVSLPGYIKYFNSSTWDQFIFYGKASDVRQNGPNSYSMVIDVDSVLLNDSLSYKKPFQLKASYDLPKHHPNSAIQENSKLHFKATVYPLEGKRNPYDFDYKSYLASRNIYLQVGIDTVYSIKYSSTLINWPLYRKKALNLIENNFDSTNAGLAKAVLIGHKDDLEPKNTRAFSRTGLSHIMAVSGLHVGFIVAPFWLLIPYMWTWRYGKQAGLIILIILLFGYAGLTGFSTSVTRASLTAGFIAYGKLFNKIRDSINLTALSAIIILLIDPGELFEIGFQLSFSAVFIILLTLPVVNHLLPDSIRFKWWGTPVRIIIVSAVVQTGLYPLLSFYFGEFALIGPLTNAIVVPVLGIAVPAALALLPFSGISPDFSFWLNAPVRWFLSFLKEFTAVTSKLEWSWIYTSTDSAIIFIVWISAILLISSLRIPAVRWKALIVFLFLLVLQTGIYLFNSVKPDNLRVTIFDVGQGDAVLVETPNGSSFLIDTGRWTPGYNSGKYVLVPHLKKAGIQKLDAVFLSHPHADHIGGIIDLINNISIDTLYNSGYRYDSMLYRSYLDLARNKNIPVKSLTVGNSVNLDSSIRIYILGPQPSTFGDDPNEYSLVIKIQYGETSFLFTGDAGHLQEERILENFDSFVDSDLLKVGHHGSRTGSSMEFLESVSPDIAAISLALRNRFGHPHFETVSRLGKATDAEIRFTSLENALIFKSDGTKISQIQWK